MILAAGTASLISWQASIPERLGILMSSSTTSGAVLVGQRDALDAVTGLAHDLDAVLDGEQHGEAAAEELLVVDDQHPGRLGRGRLVVIRHSGIMTRPGQVRVRSTILVTRRRAGSIARTGGAAD